ncbi:lysosome-associated membrane glycoprotein 2 isoform 2-T2 [Pelodytes ibericus]
MERRVSVMALCLLSLGLMQSRAFDVEVNDSSNHTCIRASLMVNFTVEYETISNAFKITSFSAPNNVTTDGSQCADGTDSLLLVVGFGDKHSWSLNFTKTSTEYSGSVLTFTYNTNDSTLFPDALKKGLLSATTKFLDPIPLNRTYRCMHDESLSAQNVTQLIWNVTLQAFVQNDTFGQEFVCDADKPPSTTLAPTTHNATVPPPTTKPVDKPSIGNYSVSNKTGRCLLASMGLQVNASLLVENKTVLLFYNIDPNVTSSSGSCGNDTAFLKLNDTRTVIEFAFTLKNKRFYLQDVNVTVEHESASISRLKQNLSFWEASFGSSYLCHKEQILSLSPDLQINTFDVRVQPFGVHNETYATAEECLADSDLNFLIPIAVGVVLLILILLVFISYLIGRRKSRTGYQSV